MSEIALRRLAEERKNWRKDHPAGFYAKPIMRPDSSQDLLHWSMGIKGREGTDWEGGIFHVTLDFTDDYPANPPKCAFDPVIFHPNVFPSGGICLSLLKKPENNYLGGLSNCWSASISLKQLALAIQELLCNPSTTHAAQREAFEMCRSNPQLYKERIRQQTKKYKAEEEM